MTTIKTTCAICGDVKLAPSDVVVTDYGHEKRYEFDCPGCDTPISRTADPRIVVVLIAAGCEHVNAQPIPKGIAAMLAGLRHRAMEHRFRAQLLEVNSLADLGWTE